MNENMIILDRNDFELGCVKNHRVQLEITERYGDAPEMFLVCLSHKSAYATCAIVLWGAGAPRSKPSVLKSSSISGQWMP